MAKLKGKNKVIKNDPTKNDTKVEAATKSPLTLSDLRNNDSLWYRILLLIYDFQHQKDKASERRTNEIIDSIYTSAPYFTPEEADSIKATFVDGTVTLEEAIQTALQKFPDKRQASADFRPCGPHDMVPVFLSCFGIDKSEIEDERFVSRVRRRGLEVG